MAVSFPVDYWDYIGWRDTLASPAFTARQKAYAAAHGEANVYTPQVIVNGLAGAAGGDRAEIEQAIKTAKGVDGALTVPMRLSETGGHLRSRSLAAAAARRMFLRCGLPAPARFKSCVARMPGAA